MQQLPAPAAALVAALEAAVTVPARPVMFRAGAMPGVTVEAYAPAALTPQVLLADVSEFQPDIADAAYLAWSKAVVIRAMYGDAHDDKAWYGGQRRADLHAGGARFIGIYQYIVAGQPGAAQADALRAIVGDLKAGEVIIADFEEGDRAVLTAWYNEMHKLYGPAVYPYLWTYSGLNFAQANGVLPVEWVAAYGQAEPASPHKLWQFTDAYPVPGVGAADCSVYHGTIDQLAALAYGGTVTIPPAPVPAPAPVKFGVCAAIGHHDTTGSGEYTLAHSPGEPEQGGFRWCHRCKCVVHP
jgi:hypothetical protein